MSPVNRARGEAALHIDGHKRRLCLTLGALAQIESALEMQSLEAMSARLRSLSAGDVLVVLEALLAGGGNPVEAAALRAAHIDPAEAARAIADAFSLATQDI